QRVQVADGADGVDLTVRDDGDARRVIAAVLELAQPVEQPLARGALSHIADDPTHPTEDTSGSQANSRCTTDTRRPQIAPASSSLGASTMTRTTGSVPPGRTRTRPRPEGPCSAAPTAPSTPPPRPSPSRRPPRPLT